MMNANEPDHCTFDPDEPEIWTCPDHRTAPINKCQCSLIAQKEIVWPQQEEEEAQRVTDDYPLTEWDGEKWIDGRVA